MIAAAKKYGARGVGIGLDPRLIKTATNALKAGVADRVSFMQADLFKTDFSDATVVTLYLSNSINQRLASILQRQLKPGRASCRTGSRWAIGSPKRTCGSRARTFTCGRFANRGNDRRPARASSENGPGAWSSEALPALRQRAAVLGLVASPRSCSACGLVYERNPGDTWAFTVIGDRLPIAAIVVLIYFGYGRTHHVLGLITFVLLGVLLVWTAPNRWGAGIALHYLSRVYWPDPEDPIPPSGDTFP